MAVSGTCLSAGAEDMQQAQTAMQDVQDQGRAIELHLRECMCDKLDSDSPERQCVAQYAAQIISTFRIGG